MGDVFILPRRNPSRSCVIVLFKRDSLRGSLKKANRGILFCSLLTSLRSDYKAVPKSVKPKIPDMLPIQFS